MLRSAASSQSSLLRVHPQVLLDVLLDGDSPDFDGPRKMPVHGTAVCWSTLVPNSKPSAAVRSSCWPLVVSAAAGGLAPVGFKQLAPTQLPVFSS